MKRILHSGIVAALIGALFMSTIPVHASGNTITVTGTADDTTVANLAGNGTCDLREALSAADTDLAVGECPAGSGTDTIAFDIGAGGAQTISLAGSLSVFNPVTIDGSTQPGFSGVPLITLSGDAGNAQQLNFADGSDGSSLKDLMFTSATWNCVWISQGADGITVTGNYFNTDGSSEVGVASHAAGVEISQASNSTVGGSTTADRNLFSGNTGVQFDGGSNNLVEGNYFGVRADGITAITGQTVNAAAILLETTGVSIPANNTIRGNVIAKFEDGIDLTDQVNHTTIAGNIIGLGADGSTQLAMSTGISIQGANTNTIGGTTAADRNIISGNTTSNIGISNGVTYHADSNIIEGNYIGTNSAGTSAAYGTSYGIQITSGDGNQIGGTAAGAGNVISGHSTEGIMLDGTPTNTQIFGNLIGTDKTGMSALPNTDDGVRLIGTGITAAIGSSTTPGNNLISGNGDGILIQNTTSGVTVFGNKIGVNLDGSGSIPNTFDSIYVGSSSAQIARNWIANSASNGIVIDNTSTLVGPSSGNCFTGNTNYGAISQNSGATAPLTGNWWGAADGPSGVALGSGDKVSTDIDFSGFLTSAPLACSPGVSLSNPALALGSQLVATTSAAKTVTLTNSGAKQLAFTSVTTAAPYSLDVTSTCPMGVGSLAPGASCTIKVKFKPTVTGPAVGSVTISTNAASSPNTIALSGTGVAGTQLLTNASFEIDANNDKKPDNWTFVNFKNGADGRDCTVKKAGLCSLKFVGSGPLKTATETILKSGIAGDDFAFNLWSRSMSVPAGAMYKLTVLLYNGGTLLTTQNLSFTIGTHAFKQVAGSIVAPGAYTKVIFRITYKAASGTVWFDPASLIWAP